MIKDDLCIGRVVEMRDGTKCLFTQDSRFYVLDDGTWHCSLNDFNDDLTMDEEEYDVMKIYEDYTCSKVIWERDVKDKKHKLRELLEEILKEL